MVSEREQERKTYRLCQLGFGLLAGVLTFVCLLELVSIPGFFIDRRFLAGLFNSPLVRWSDTGIVFGSLTGFYLLVGRWQTTSWQRRTGLLVVMGIIDAVLWTVQHGEELGLRMGDVGHVWFRSNLGHALGWAELALLASVASEVLVHLGVTQASEAGRATRSLAASGATIWMLFFFLSTDRRAGWPLIPLPPRQETVLLEIGTNLIYLVILIQVTALTIAATRRCGLTMKEIDQEDRENDPLRSESDKDYALDPRDRF